MGTFIVSKISELNTFLDQVQGIPLQLWSDVALKSLANDIGIFDKVEITSTKARMKVLLDGLQPLIKKATMEFDTGEEVEVTLVYEKLEKHCSLCLMLDHEQLDCPTVVNKSFQSQERASEASKREHSRNQIHDAYPEYHARATSHFNSRSQRDNHRNPTPGEDRHRAEREKPIYSGGSRQRSPPLRNREFNLPYSRNERANYYSPRELNETSSAHSREYRRPLNQSSDRTLSDKPLSHHIQKNTSHRQIWVEKPPRPREPAPEMIPRSEHSASSKPPYQQNEDMAPDTALNAAMTEVREVMKNYTNFADPVESAARKERFRLAEEAGEVVEAATLMLRVPPSNNPQNANPSVLRENLSPNTSRIPATMRLGPIRETEEDPVTPPETLPVATKRRPGRPPGRRNVILSPLSFLGVGVRRRTISKTQPSQLKRRIPSTIPRREVNIRKNMKTNGAGPSTIHKGPKVPKTSKAPPKKLWADVEADFRHPSSPLP